MARKTPQFEVFPTDTTARTTQGRRYYSWRLRARNGQIVMTSGESFAGRYKATLAVDRVKELATAAVVIVDDAQ